MLDIKELKKLIYIDDQGDLRWYPRTVDMFKDSGHKTALQYCNGWNTRYANQLALWTIQNCKGFKYRRGRINRISHLSHRVLFMLYHDRNIKEGYVIDHIDGDTLNNSIDNLREITQNDNVKNAKVPKTNTSGHIGIHKVKNKYRTTISLNSKSTHIGVFGSLEEAIEARKEKEKEHGYMPEHGSR